MKTIYTIQHTQSVHHTNGMVGSWTDWPLTELGLAQAQRISGKLKNDSYTDSVILYSSDLLRAKQTADCIGHALGIQPILRQELRERNLGQCCGKSVAWLREHKTMIERTVDDRLFPDAESRRDVWNRLLPCFHEIMSSDAECVAIVSHGDLLSVFNAMFLGLAVDDLNRIDLWGQSGGVSMMQVKDDGKHVIRKLSDMSYLL